MNAWQAGNVNPTKTGEYLTALRIGPKQYTYIVDNFHVQHGWEMEAFTGTVPDLWQEIQPIPTEMQR